MRLRTNRLYPIWLTLCIVSAPCAAQQIVYVDVDRPPGGDGTSWTTAFNTLQDALAEAATLPAGVEARLWIAEGTYRPDVGSGIALGDRTASFEVTDEMVLLGGFDGSEVDSSLRDPVTNPVIFSGDLAQDDVPPFGNNTENSLRIVTTCSACSGAAMIDGVTIRGGNADIAGTTSGAGVFVLGGDLQLSLVNCDIRFNSANSGGAIVAANAIVTIDGCLVENNRGLNDADALWAIGSSEVTLISTVFNANTGPGQTVVNEFGSRVFAHDTELEAVENIGRLEAGGELTAGIAIVSGTYVQENADVAGVLEFDLGGTTLGVDHDRVDIAAQANLAGVASLNLINGYMPTGTESFELLQAGIISHEFDLALFPLIDNGLSMELAHTGTESVVASMTTLSTILDFAAPIDVGFQGQATDIALGDFNADSLAEAAMTVPGDSPGTPGDVVILVNDGIGGEGWNGFGPDVTVTVGAEPVAIAVGDLNGDTFNDIVTANFEDDTVSVLLNNNDLLGETPFSRTDYSTGAIGPLDVAIGDTDMMNGPDIIIAN